LRPNPGLLQPLRNAYYGSLVGLERDAAMALHAVRSAMPPASDQQ
jgi:hypothetical protein